MALRVKEMGYVVQPRRRSLALAELLEQCCIARIPTRSVHISQSINLRPVQCTAVIVHCTGMYLKWTTKLSYALLRRGKWKQFQFLPTLETWILEVEKVFQTTLPGCRRGFSAFLLEQFHRLFLTVNHAVCWELTGSMRCSHVNYFFHFLFVLWTSLHCCWQEPQCEMKKWETSLSQQSFHFMHVPFFLERHHGLAWTKRHTSLNRQGYAPFVFFTCQCDECHVI